MASASSSEQRDAPGDPEQPGDPQEAGDPIPQALLNSPDYEIIRELSRGGMGVVYLVRNRRMDRLECLKVINVELLKQAGSRERFEREMRSAARVNHPHVVTAYSAPQLEGLLAFAMEYVDGVDLARLVAMHGPLPVSNACYYIQQVAKALQYAHEKSMVHRDIKPGNLMLARDGHRDVIKILDFGLAKATSESPTDKALTQAGQVLGTPLFMSPEQIKNAGQADIRADIYSLGCTLYYLLIGSCPFQDKSSLYELLHAQQYETPQPLNEVRTDVPAELAGIVAKMTAKDPLHRYQEPGEVAQVLAPFFKHGLEPLAARPEGDDTCVPGQSQRLVATETQSSMKSPTFVPAAAGTAVPPTRSDLVPTMIEDVTPSIPQPESGNRTNMSDQRHSNRNKPRRIWWRVIPVALIAGGAALWWFGVIDVKTRYGTLTLDVNEPNAEVYVDNVKTDVEWDKDGKKAELELKTGNRNIEVSKDGFTVAEKELMIKEGESYDFKVRLAPLRAPPGGVPPGATASTPGAASPNAATPGSATPDSATPGQSASTTASPQPATTTTAASTTPPQTPANPASTSPPAPPAHSFAGHAAGEERDDNGLKMKFAWCPPGKFTMGSPHSEKDRGVDEEQVAVALTKGFWLGSCEVTQGQWSQLLGTTPWKGETNVQEGPDFPATFVNWEDATAFCGKLTGEELAAGRLAKGCEYVLPTEAQWEYACRAGTKSMYSFGADSKRLAEFGWFKTNSIDAGEKFAHTVRLKHPNAWRLYDMHGNTFEWCRDAFTVKLPGGADPFVSAGGPQRVYRGGGWFNTPQYCRSAIRRGLDPAFKGNALGFRVACVSAGGG